jgi:hypothetical protein
MEGLWQTLRIPIYQTESLSMKLDEVGQPVVVLITDREVNPLAVNTYDFVLDEAGDLIPATIGTGRAIGPGVYLRLQDVFDGDEALSLEGGLTYNF